jgi:hypothetical protein
MLPKLYSHVYADCFRKFWQNWSRSVTTPHSSKFWATWLAVLALAVGLGFFLSPATVRASCGDYLMASGRHQSTSPSMPGEKAKELPAPDPGKAPCSGPHCSQGSEQTPLAPASVVPSSSENWVAVFALPTVREGDIRLLLKDSICIYPVNHSSRIERPPRSNSL